MQQKPRRIFLTVSVVFISLLAVNSFFAAQPPLKAQRLIVFYSSSCHKCIQAKNELMPGIEKKFKGQLVVEYRDIGDIENYKLLLSLEKRYNPNIKNLVPIFYIAGKFLNGEGELEKPLEAMINQAQKVPFQEEENLPAVDLFAHFKSFRLFFVISAGLIDGINPCAFSVIVFFISYLALQGYRRRELIAVGSSFIFGLFITYILIGLGLFAFLYKIKEFWMVSKIVNFSIGVLSIVLGLMAIYDFLKFKKTKSTDGLLLQLPQGIKDRIRRIIGLHYRKTKDDQGAALKKNIFKLILAAFVTGFLVTILEAACTGQTYLPTLSFILKTTSFKLEVFTYLLLYNLMFTVPLIVIFLFALLGVTSGQFSKFLKQHLLTLKLLMAILFFSLGIFLIWRA